MNTTRSPKQSSITSRSAKAIIGVLAMTVALAISANAAGAYSTNQSGYVGTITTPAQVQGWIASYASGSLATGAVTGTKAPAYANYDQYLCSTTRLWMLSSGVTGQKWTLSNSYRQCGWAKGSITNVSFSGVTFSSAMPYTGFSIDTIYTWQLSNGTQIGSKWTDMSQQADYRCVSSRCNTGTSTIGGYIMFDF